MSKKRNIRSTPNATKARGRTRPNGALLPLDTAFTRERQHLLPMPGPELVIGLAYPVGTNATIMCDLLRETLARLGYNTYQIHLIEALRQIDRWSTLPSNPLDERYQALMTAGNEFREALIAKEALALLACAQIRNYRNAQSGDPNRPSPRTAYLIRSLKNPDEVECLRRIYGRNFVLVSAFSSKKHRVDRLSAEIAASTKTLLGKDFEDEAKALVERDEEEPDLEFGQNLRKAYPLADFFVNADDTKGLKYSLERVLELFFGNFVHTPSRDEQGMFQAFGASVRSASLARQVGACICSKNGSIVSIGCNDVPRAKGGLYWEDDGDDARDHVLGYDSNDRAKRDLLKDILKRLKDNQWLNVDHELQTPESLVEKALSKTGPLRKAQIMNITEYGRAVHAEMAAITDAAAKGASVQDCVLYSTTFPCHNCAKHIVAAGISRVIYVEPYPKSLTAVLHRDSINLDGIPSSSEGRICFESFVGVAPRQFLRLFSMGHSERKRDGTVIKWEPYTAIPSDLEQPNTYLLLEGECIVRLTKLLAEAKLSAITELTEQPTQV